VRLCLFHDLDTHIIIFFIGKSQKSIHANAGKAGLLSEKATIKVKKTDLSCQDDFAPGAFLMEAPPEAWVRETAFLLTCAAKKLWFMGALFQLHGSPFFDVRPPIKSHGLIRAGEKTGPPKAVLPRLCV